MRRARRSQEARLGTAKYDGLARRAGARQEVPGGTIRYYDVRVRATSPRAQNFNRFWFDFCSDSAPPECREVLRANGRRRNKAKLSKVAMASMENRNRGQSQRKRCGSKTSKVVRASIAKWTQRRAAGSARQGGEAAELVVRSAAKSIAKRSSATRQRRQTKELARTSNTNGRAALELVGASIEKRGARVS